MTQEDKELLLKDLCARLPYGVMCYNRGTESNFRLCDVADIDSGYPTFDYGYGELQSILPYLRPMSSMTEEEKEYIKNRWCCEDWDDIYDFFNHYKIDAGDTYAFIDWLNAHHFDFRNLIGRGLAIDCTGLNVY